MVLLILIQRRLFFCFKFELLRAQPCWFAVCHWRVEKDWLCLWCHVHLCHIYRPCLWCHRLGPKGSAAHSCTLWLSNISFNKLNCKPTDKCCDSVLYSISIDITCETFLLGVLRQIQVNSDTLTAFAYCYCTSISKAIKSKPLLWEHSTYGSHCF